MHTLLGKDKGVESNVGATTKGQSAPNGTFEKPPRAYEVAQLRSADRVSQSNSTDLSDWRDKVIYPHFDESGRMYDQHNVPVNLEPSGWGDFLMNKNGKLITGKGWHGILYELQEKPELGSSGFGVWHVEDGWLRRVNPVCATFYEQSYDPRFAAQLRYQLAKDGVDLRRVVFDTESQGAIWKGEAAELTVERMRNDAQQVFRGYGDDFWVDVTEVARRADRVDVGLSLNPVRGEPGQVTVSVQRVGELTTVRFMDLDMGAEPARTSTALRALHEKMTPWITESGASWSRDPMP